MKIAYVRTGRGVQTNAYALRTGGGGRSKIGKLLYLWMAPNAIMLCL